MTNSGDTAGQNGNCESSHAFSPAPTFATTCLPMIAQIRTPRLPVGPTRRDLGYPTVPYSTLQYRVPRLPVGPTAAT